MTQQLNIKSVVYHLPDRYVNSEEVDSLYNAPLGNTEENIGIKSRYYFDKETVLEGAAKAAQKAIIVAGLSWKDIDCLVAASATKWQPIPSMAACIKKELGLNDFSFPCYTIDRPTPKEGLQKFTVDEMRALVQPLIDEGFTMQIKG